LQPYSPLLEHASGKKKRKSESQFIVGDPIIKRQLNKESIQQKLLVPLKRNNQANKKQHQTFSPGQDSAAKLLDESKHFASNPTEEMTVQTTQES